MGIEPTTLGLLDPRSNQLSYESLVAFGDNLSKTAVYKIQFIVVVDSTLLYCGIAYL